MRVLLATVASALAAVAFTDTGGAASACWHDVLAEWAAGSVGTGHRLECYRDAIAKAPLDLRLYSSVQEDLQRALARAAQNGNRPTAEKVRTLAGRRSVASPVSEGSGGGGAPVAVLALALALALVLGALVLRRRRRA